MRHLLVTVLVLMAPAAASAQTAGFSPSAGFSPGYGFWVGDARGVATLRTSLQARYFCESSPEGDDVPCRPNGFVLRRARVRLGAVIPDPSLELAVQADLADLDQPVEEAWALFRPWTFLRIGAGRQRIPFTREGLYPEERVPFSELSPLTNLLQPPRDVGLYVGLHQGPFDATLGAFNGAPDVFSNDNVDLLYAARLQLDVLGTAADPPGNPPADGRPGISVGVGAAYDLPPAAVDGAGEPANVRVAALTADLSVRALGASLDLAGGWRENDRGALEGPSDVVRERGVTATLAYGFEVPRLVPAARFTLLQEKPSAGETIDAWELAASVSWRTGAADLLTVLCEYSLVHRDDLSAEVHQALAELRIVL